MPLSCDWFFRTLSALFMVDAFHSRAISVYVHTQDLNSGEDESTLKGAMAPPIFAS